MAIRTLNTAPRLALDVTNNSVIGDFLFVLADNADTGNHLPGMYPVHQNSGSRWDQLQDILNYCGIPTATPQAAQTWFKGQTEVSFVNAIRKYLNEVFFPGLAAFLNKFITASGSSTGGTVGSMTDVKQGWEYILKNMSVTLGSDGKITGIAI